jgi:hypothetical protein
MLGEGRGSYTSARTRAPSASGVCLENKVWAWRRLRIARRLLAFQKGVLDTLDMISEPAPGIGTEAESQRGIDALEPAPTRI